MIDSALFASPSPSPCAGVSIVQLPSLPPRTQWANATNRAEWINATVAHVVARNYSGLTFDYEGDFLSSSERSGYTALAEETMTALRSALGSRAYLSVCVGGRPSYEFRNYDYIAMAATTTQFFVMSYDMVRLGSGDERGRGAALVRPGPRERPLRILGLSSHHTTFTGLALDGNSFSGTITPVYNKCSLAEAPLRDINLGKGSLSSC